MEIIYLLKLDAWDVKLYVRDVKLNARDEAAGAVKLHVVLQSVAPVESFRAEVAREGHFAAVDERVLLQVVLHAEPLRTLGAGERSGGVFGGRVVGVVHPRGGVDLGGAGDGGVWRGELGRGLPPDSLGQAELVEGV